MLSHSLESGFSVRVIVENGWGFTGYNRGTKKDVTTAVEQAIKIGKATARSSKHPIRLAPTKIVEDRWESEVKIDPMKVPMEEVLELLLSADKAYRDNAPHLRSSNASQESRVVDMCLATSEGTRIEQKITFCGADGRGFVKDGSLVQRRSWNLNPQTKGYEYIKENELEEIGASIGKEAEMLLKAEKCPSEVRTNLILDDPHMFLQIHETIGHATELDRVLGTEADRAGMSFLTPEKLGNFKYGSDQVNFVADPTICNGVATYGYDDEGVPAKKEYLVENGLFVGYQSSRETAAQLGLEESSSGMRASTPVDLPIIRMNNICLEPGDWKADEVIEDTKDGILMRTTQMWSIDQRRLNFQFGCEIGWIIKNGELSDVIRDPTYTGISYEFWNNLDATARDDWKLYGTTGCGKGRPGQGIWVGHGAATSRIKDVRIGIMGGD